MSDRWKSDWDANVRRRTQSSSLRLSRKRKKYRRRRDAYPPRVDSRMYRAVYRAENTVINLTSQMTVISCQLRLRLCAARGALSDDGYGSISKWDTQRTWRCAVATTRERETQDASRRYLRGEMNKRRTKRNLRQAHKQARPDLVFSERMKDANAKVRDRDSTPNVESSGLERVAGWWDIGPPPVERRYRALSGNQRSR